MRLAPALLAVPLALQLGPAQAGACWFQPFSTIPGADVSLRWVAKSGHPCALTITVGRGLGVTDMRVSEQPAHGTVSLPSFAVIRYVSRPGFVGHDRFVVSRTAEAMWRLVTRGTAHWTIDVDVVP